MRGRAGGQAARGQRPALRIRQRPHPRGPVRRHAGTEPAGVSPPGRRPADRSAGIAGQARRGGGRLAAGRPGLAAGRRGRHEPVRGERRGRAGHPGAGGGRAGGGRGGNRSRAGPARPCLSCHRRRCRCAGRPDPGRRPRPHGRRPAARDARLVRTRQRRPGPVPPAHQLQHFQSGERAADRPVARRPGQRGEHALPARGDRGQPAAPRRGARLRPARGGCRARGRGRPCPGVGPGRAQARLPQPRRYRQPDRRAPRVGPAAAPSGRPVPAPVGAVRRRVPGHLRGGLGAGRRRHREGHRAQSPVRLPALRRMVCGAPGLAGAAPGPRGRGHDAGPTGRRADRAVRGHLWQATACAMLGGTLLLAAEHGLPHVLRDAREARRQL